MQKTAALRAAVFLLSAKNLRGAVNCPPPATARVKALLHFYTKSLQGLTRFWGEIFAEIGAFS